QVALLPRAIPAFQAHASHPPGVGCQRVRLGRTARQPARLRAHRVRCCQGARRHAGRQGDAHCHLSLPAPGHARRGLRLAWGRVLRQRARGGGARRQGATHHGGWPLPLACVPLAAAAGPRHGRAALRGDAAPRKVGRGLGRGGIPVAAALPVGQCGGGSPPAARPRPRRESDRHQGGQRDGIPLRRDGNLADARRVRRWRRECGASGRVSVYVWLSTWSKK
ncbi:hypothetical protein EMIHUDRAFT_450363, partial [Emiliania huxleyi CCMP1516]|uniref:Uncharacterized protein n=2 Tax=Emiliania huxleyi TaxID=2903 RepID=A0A0D3JQG4_EMIH1